MKIYSKKPSEGYKPLIGYLCDFCGDRESGEDLPENWLEDENTHYCLNCQRACMKCTKLFSAKYAEDYFNCGICENCMEDFNKFLYLNLYSRRIK